MRILWINSRADFTGGCESYIYHTARLLKEEGCENILLYGVDGWTEPRFTSIFDEAYPLVVLERQIKEIAPDIVYAHRLPDNGVLQQLIKSPVPVIRFYHDHKLFCLREHKYYTISHNTCRQRTGFGCYTCLGFLRKTNGIFKIGFSSLAKLHRAQAMNRQLDGYIVASEYMKKHIMLHGFAEDKIKVIPLYSWKKEENNPEITDGNYLLFAGQILRGKGLDILLKALKNLPGTIKLKIAGSGKQKGEYEQLVKDLGISERVEFLGFVDQDKLKELYKNCTCVVMPSRVPETFGLTGLEAMSFGKPVIASDVGGISQWLENGKNGYLVAGNDVLAMSKALDALLSNRQNAEEMGRNGYLMYKDRFIPERHIQPLKEYFAKKIREEKQ